MTGLQAHDPAQHGRSLAEAITARTRMIQDHTGEQVSTIDDMSIRSLHRAWGRSIPEIHRSALEQGVVPLRYLRNRTSLSMQEQLQLAESCVAVVGAGGLGGQVLLSLARIGVGRLIVVDPGRFEESNLNRQVLCTPGSLGQAKVSVAKYVLEDINPAVEVHPHPLRITPDNCQKLLGSADVVVDALDNVTDRFILQAGAQAASIPLIHAAIDGFVGRVMTIFPEDQGLDILYGPDRDQPLSPLGNLPMTAHTVASLQAMEVLKVLLHRGRPFRGHMLSLELEEGLLELFSVNGDA